MYFRFNVFDTIIDNSSTIITEFSLFNASVTNSTNLNFCPFIFLTLDAHFYFSVVVVVAWASAHFFTEIVFVLLFCYTLRFLRRYFCGVIFYLFGKFRTHSSLLLQRIQIS